MNIKTRLKVAAERITKIICVATAFTSIVLSPAALAELNTSDGGWLAGMVSSGSAPFDHLDPSKGDELVRTHDSVTYRVGFTTVNGSDTNARITLSAGEFTLPANYTGPTLTSIGYFDVIDIPTSCTNISQTAVDEPPAAGVSGIAADGQTLFCAQPSPTNGNNLDFRFNISGVTPNGTTFKAPSITFSSVETAANSNPQALIGGAGASTFYGLQELTAVSEPRWNVAASYARPGSYVPRSGPNGEDGFIFSWSLGVYGQGSKKGIEALGSNFEIEIDFNDSDFPNASIVNWDIQVPNYASANLSNAGTEAHDGCGNWNNKLKVQNNVFDNSYFKPVDLGNNYGGTASSVSYGGDCALISSPTNANKVANFEVQDTDFSLTHWPTKKGKANNAETLINLANADDTSNEWWVANKSILIWVPDSDIPNNTTQFMTINTSISGKSISEQNNVEPIASDNSSTSAATRMLTGKMYEIHTPPIWSNPYGFDYSKRDPNITTDALVNQISPDQVLASRLLTYNGSTVDFPQGYLCDKIDNTRFTYFDTRAAAYTASSSYLKDEKTGIFVRHSAGPTFPITWELGVGGSGISPEGGWESYSGGSSEYSNPSTSGSEQSDNGCDDLSATWYSSIDELLDAEGTDGLKKITRVRGSYASYPVGGKILVFIPQQTNSVFSYTGMDSDQQFSANDSTLGSMATHQMLWNTNIPELFEQGLGKASDAVKIFQTEYAKISKTSSSHSPSGSLANVGDSVNFEITLNLSTSGSSHSTDVTVWDILPSHLSYIAGSSLFGGVALQDPTCQNTQLPAELFPGTATTSEGAIPGGNKVCEWKLPYQQVTKAATGDISANLPTFEYSAAIAANTPSAAQLITSATVDSTNNLVPLPYYEGDDQGFTCETNETCSFSNWLLNTQATPGVVLNKTVSSKTIPLEGVLEYNLTYGAIGQSLSAPRILDIFPYSGDDRSSSSTYEGTFKLSQNIIPPIADTAFGTNSDTDFVALYSIAEPSFVDKDPYGTGHNLSGDGSNSASETNWCTEVQFGQSNCPTDATQSTAVMLLPDGASGNSAILPEGSTYRVKLQFATEGNKTGDVYSNNFSADSPSLTARRPSSNTVTSVVKAPDLVIAKTVTPDTAALGSDVNFELSVKNNNSDTTSPIYESPTPDIRVVDTMPEGLVLSSTTPSADGWDCSATTEDTVDCTYTGSYPLGTGAAVGSPLVFSATVADTVADNAWIENTATVSLSGVAESDTDNNTDGAFVRVLRDVDLTLIKSADRSTATQTEAVTYTLEANVDANGGRVNEGPITVTDDLPVGLSITAAIDVTGTDWDCSASTAPSTVSCTYSGAFPIDLGTQVGGDVVINATVDATAAVGDLINTASVSIAGEKDTSNNTGTSTVTISEALAAVSGHVYVDTDTNGINNNSGTALAQVELTLCLAEESPCSAANTLASTSSDANGYYQFDNVAQGNFYVVQTQPLGYGSSTDNIVSLTRTGTTPTADVDFGETLGRISGYVYADIDTNGVRAATGETGIGIATEIVLRGTTVDHTTGQDVPVEVRVTADAVSGAYSFDGILAPKAGTSYTLTQEPSSVTGFANAVTNVGSLNTAGNATATAAGSADSAASQITGIGFEPDASAQLAFTIDGQNYNFGETPQAGISGRVFIDSNANNSNDASDTGLESVTLVLCLADETPCSNANTLNTTQTAPDGGYLFNNVPAGSYFVQQLQPASYGSATANTVPATRVADEALTNIDFIERGATLAGQVFVDSDRSGGRGPNDADYNQGTAEITLTGTTADGDALEIVQTVDASGHYNFNDLPAPDSNGYSITLDSTTVTAPLFAVAAHLGAVSHADSSPGTDGVLDNLAMTGVSWTIDQTIASVGVATGLSFDFSVMTGAAVSGRVMRDINGNGNGSTTTDPSDLPQAGVSITLCRSENNPCPTADVVETVQTDDYGNYSFSEVMPGNYWAVEEQPATLGNGPGASDIQAITVGTQPVENVDFLNRASTLSGTVFRDNDANGVDDSEPGIAGVTVTLTGLDVDGNTVEMQVQTDQDGNYRFEDIPAPDASGYTLTESDEPANTRDGTALPGDTVDALNGDLGSSGTLENPDVISAIQLVPGGSGDNFDFSELPATASVSGSVWRDRDSDRSYGGDEDAVPGWTVQLLHIDPVDGGTTVVAEQVTGNDGKYNFSGQTPGDYQIVFRGPTLDANGEPAIWGTPVNGERGAPTSNSNAEIADGIIRRITLMADQSIEQQSLPLDPSGVVYDSDKRVPVPGTSVVLVGPAGFDPAQHLLGGAAASVLTTGTTGEYQFLLLANAPAGEYSLSVAPPAGYSYMSQVLPPETGVLTPPTDPAAVFPVVPSEMAPAVGAPTTYYTRFNLTPGVSSGVVHNHIPLDPNVEPALFVTKQADSSTVEVGDSLKYTVRMHNRGTAAAPALALEDTLPLGFKYIEGTAKLLIDGAEQPLADPEGSPGPSLLFSIPGSLDADTALQVSYRVRVGVGADRGDGINRAIGHTGLLRSEEALARVQVSGGVLGDEACLVGRVFVDCNHDHVQNGEELGIPGVRLYMEDGRYLVTDVEGKYSSCDLTPQTHILKVDRMTLPRGSRLTTSSNRNLGDANSLFVDMKDGELHRADFIEGSCTSMVLEQVRARRSNGEVLQAQIEARGAASLSQRSNSSGVNRGTVSADQTLVRARPAQGAQQPLTHSQDHPQSQQIVQGGTEFYATDAANEASLFEWDDSELAGISLQSDVGSAPADGLGAVRFTVRLTDDSGQRLPGRQLVTLLSDGGHLWLPGSDTHEHTVRSADLDPATPGMQAWAQDGRLIISLLAPDQPQKISITASAGARQVKHSVAFVPALREWIAAGLVEGIVRLNDESGLSAVNSDGLFERELLEWQRSFDDERGSAAARVAFFVKGTIKGKYLLTASYDSEKADNTRILQDIQPEQLYPVFGDASVKGFEAQSSGKLFVRISRDKHYLLYGDFQSENGSADLGANNRTLTGARLHLDGERGLLDVYAANDTLRHQVEELTPNGTSGPYGINGLAVENTERVELIIRDSNLRSRIIERRTLTRLVDYSFDAFSGRFLFKEPVSRTDGNGNPQSIRISYEQDGSGSSSWAAGVRAELQVGESVRLGGSYSRNDLDAVSEDELGELASLDIAVAINDWVKVRAEVAQSTTLSADGSGDYTGDAAKLEIAAGHVAGSWSAVLHAVQSDEDFRNANASVDAGRGEIGLRLQAAISETFDLQSDLQRSTDDSTGAQVDSSYLGLKIRPTDGFAVSAGIRHLQDNGLGLINNASIETNGSVYNGSGLSNAGTGLFNSGESISGTVDGDALDTTSLMLGVNWAVSDKLNLGLEAEDSVAGDDSWRAAVKAGWVINSQHTLQARYETQTGLAGDLDRRQESSAFVFGLTRNFDEDGSHFTELRLRDGIGGREAHLAYGIRNGFDLGSGLRGMASAEQVAILDGEGRKATSGALGLNHTGGERWKGTARVEARRLHDDKRTAEDDSTDSWLANLSVARKLDSSWTALAKYIALGSDDKSLDGDQSQQRLQVGAAYRPVDNNRVAVITKLEHRRERNSELATPESRDTWVASVNSNWHPTRAWWLGARLATKDVNESLDGVQDDYQASLAGVRATYDVTERTDIGVMGNYRYSPNGHTNDWAAGVEMGYAVKSNLWLSLGYNWGGFSDKDLAGSNYTQRGWYIRLRYKFDEDLFNGASTSVNRSLPRSAHQQESH